MRITYLHQYFNTHSMVGGTRSFEMARRLVAKGHHVTMVTADREGNSAAVSETVEDGIRVIWLPVRYKQEMSYWHRIRAFLLFVWLATRVAWKLPADVVLATSTPLTIIIPAAMVVLRQRVPLVFEVRDLWPEVPIAMGALRGWPLKASARLLERFAYALARHIVALSPGMREGILRTGVPPERITVIPNACDLDLFAHDEGAAQDFRQRHPWLLSRPLVVYIGTLGRVNGVGYLAHLAEAVKARDANVRFLTVGNGSDFDSVRELAQALGVLDVNFFMMESVPKSHVPAILSAADVATSVFIDIPELESNSANKFFDALASGTPVAINYGGWQAEYLATHQAGLTLSRSDIDAAAREITALVQDRDRMKAMGEAALSLARDHFDRDVLAAQLEQVITDAIRPRV